MSCRFLFRLTSILCLIISVCEWLFAAEVCLYNTVSFFLLSPIVVFSQCVAAVCSYSLHRGHVGEPLFIQQTRQYPPEWGVLLQRATGSPPMLRSLITQQNLALRMSSKHTANGTFICLPSRPLPQQPSFTGILSAISSHPMETVGSCQQGDNFLMMSPCHGVRRSVAKI